MTPRLISSAWSIVTACVPMAMMVVGFVFAAVLPSLDEKAQRSPVLFFAAAMLVLFTIAMTNVCRICGHRRILDAMLNIGSLGPIEASSVIFFGRCHKCGRENLLP